MPQFHIGTPKKGQLQGVQGFSTFCVFPHKQLAPQNFRQFSHQSNITIYSQIHRAILGAGPICQTTHKSRPTWGAFSRRAKPKQGPGGQFGALTIFSKALWRPRAQRLFAPRPQIGAGKPPKIFPHRQFLSKPTHRARPNLGTPNSTKG